MKDQKKLYEGLTRHMELKEIQDYIKQVIEIRGFGNQPIEQALLLLMEETGELAKAIRKEKTSMKIDIQNLSNNGSVEEEIADVFIVLNSICNLLDLDLFDAFYKKEAKNLERSWE